MAVMHILRMLVDVSFFGTFAGLIAARCGGTGAFVGVLLQCLCFGLSYLGGSRRWLRLLGLLPILAGWWFARGSLADCILLLPTAAYVVWLAFRGDYTLDHDRQRHLFGAFWKILIAFMLVALLLGCMAQVTAVSLPYALVMLVCSVLLLRALRHDPKVYCQRRYQLVNLFAVAVVVALAWLVTAPVVVNGCIAALKALLTYVIQPVLELLLNVLLRVISGVVWLFSKLFSGGAGREQEEEPLQIDMSGVQDILTDNFVNKEPAAWLRILLIVLGCAAAAALLVLFFRWLNRHRGGEGSVVLTDERQDIPAARQNVRKKESSPVRSIRAQYRKFLKLCTGLGVRQEKSTTSLEIHRQVEMISGPAEASAQIRELYIQARYAGKADAEGVKKMKQLCAEAGKPSNAIT